LPLCASALDPASDTISASPLPATAWHLAPAGRRGDKPKRQRFKRYPYRLFHIHCPAGGLHGKSADIAEVQTAEGKLYLFVGIDRTSKFAVTQLADKADRRTAWEFLQHMLEAVPYQHPHDPDRQWHPVRRAAEEPEHDHLPADALRHDL
jgi:hypothetical protein